MTGEREALQAEIDALKTQYRAALVKHRAEQAGARVDKWIGCGDIPSGCREDAIAIVFSLLECDGGYAHVDALENILQQTSAPRVQRTFSGPQAERGE